MPAALGIFMPAGLEVGGSPRPGGNPRRPGGNDLMASPFSSSSSSFLDPSSASMGSSSSRSPDLPPANLRLWSLLLAKSSSTDLLRNKLGVTGFGGWSSSSLTFSSLWTSLSELCSGSDEDPKASKAPSSTEVEATAPPSPRRRKKAKIITKVHKSIKKPKKRFLITNYNED